MAQWFAFKEAHPDALVFFRMGDFYELFFADAEAAAGPLGVALTARGEHGGRPIPMCGVPVHASDAYLARLIRGGFRVAIVEQMEKGPSEGGCQAVGQGAARPPGGAAGDAGHAHRGDAARRQAVAPAAGGGGHRPDRPRHPRRGRRHGRDRGLRARPARRGAGADRPGRDPGRRHHPARRTRRPPRARPPGARTPPPRAPAAPRRSVRPASTRSAPFRTPRRWRWRWRSTTCGSRGRAPCPGSDRPPRAARRASSASMRPRARASTWCAPATAARTTRCSARCAVR